MDWKDFFAIGMVGGILITWKEDIVRCVEYIRGECLISCLFGNKRGGECWAFTRIYNKSEGSERASLWRDLDKCKRKWSHPWVVCVGIST